MLIRENSAAFDGEGGVQLKNYCPAVEVDDVKFPGGLVHIGGVGGPDGQEMAQLISFRKADCNDLLEWRQAVIDLEAKAYDPGPDGADSPDPYLPPNVAHCDLNDLDANCPNHEPADGPESCPPAP